MSESEGTEVTRRRRGTSPAAQDSLPEDDDLLREILIRLPPQPSSLPRASAVCKPWRRLVTDPKFDRQFCAHHRKPPLLGLFVCSGGEVVFRSILDPPDRIPPERFDLRRQTGRRAADVLGCRHGRVLLLDLPRHKVIVCDPITGEHHHIDPPPVFHGLYINGDVLCASADKGHVHGSCHSSPFKVVLMSVRGGKHVHQCGGGCKVTYDYGGDAPPIACVYSSETGQWSNLISATDPCDLGETNPGILVGNVLYWSSMSVIAGGFLLDPNDFTDNIVEFDLDRQNLAVIKGPPCLNGSFRHQIIQAEDGAVGLATLSRGRFEIWQREAVNCHGDATWLLHKTVETHIVLGLPLPVEGSMREMGILGYDEYKGSIFVCLGTSVYMIQLMSMQSRKLFESDDVYRCHPFTSFYASACGCDGAEMLPNCLV